MGQTLPTTTWTDRAQLAEHHRAIGKEHSDLGDSQPGHAAHRELGDGIDRPMAGGALLLRSDHYNFARKASPFCSSSMGCQEDYHEVTDSPEKINSDKEARILACCYIRREVGNAPTGPSGSRRAIRRL